MPIISGEGGGGFSGGVVAGAVTVAEPSNTASDLFVIDVPADYANQSQTGNVFRVRDGGVNTLYADAFGDFRVTCPTGQGNPNIGLHSTDNPAFTINLSNLGIWAVSAASVNMVTATAASFSTAAAAVGFFGVTPAAQPAAPVTLGDVIAALQTLGLVAT